MKVKFYLFMIPLLVVLLAISVVACAPAVAPAPTPATTPTTPEPTTPSSPDASAQSVEATVTQVADGDAIKVNIGKKTYTVRYLGINAPEMVGSNNSPDYMGQEASDKNKEFVAGKTVRLERDVSDTDKYGRLLRYVYVGDLMVNAELIKLGYAKASIAKPDVKYQDLFLKLQAEAKDAKRGLWAPRPTP